MGRPNYSYQDRDCFVVEQYNDCAPFASFLPGIAGVTGRPAWFFYVNRGQAAASFGVRNKDGAFLEFFPADKAYQLTPSRGFRTFIKIGDGKDTLTHEPFQRGAGPKVSQRLFVSPHEVGVEEINPALGLTIRADMFTLPEAPVAGLLRQVTVTNTSGRVKRFDIVDGLPQVLPYALNQWCVKFMSRTSEAFMRVEGVEDNLPFYRLKVWPSDSPHVEPVLACNFFAGFLNGTLNQVIVDPEQIFGLAGDFSAPERFFANEAPNFAEQVTGNQTPAAFQAMSFELQPGASQVYYGFYGHASSIPLMRQFAQDAALADYFESKQEANRRLVADIAQRAFTLTARPLFDAHTKQCYLDNGLRGGFSMAVPGGARLYLFGRKHGDLERDYNDFLLQDTPYSEGNGDFRDVLQNRRVDLFFDPELGDSNIRYFFNLIQPDGYNPCSLRNSRFSVTEPDMFSRYFDRFDGLEALLNKEFKYAELWQLLQTDKEDPEPVLREILATSEPVEDAEFDRGYWSDHWTYLVDLLMNFAAIFPDRLSDLFFSGNYTFFDPSHFVQPRSKKYVLTEHGVRQLGAVEARPEKKALFESRSRRRYQVRSRHGQGEIVYSTLLGKIVTLIANKLATLDPAGVGIEMEADRPGWCDALNGLPGIFGSSVNETIELKRLADFSHQALAGSEGECRLPEELADFVAALHALLQQPALTSDEFYEQSVSLKETYRERIFMGFDGAERELSVSAIRDFLSRVSSHLSTAIDKAKTPGGIVTYFAYEAESYREIGDGRVAVGRFRQIPQPLFLEGFVHALRIADPQEARTLFDAVQRSPLFDNKLGMYRVNAPLGDNALDFGRIGVFNYGWLENGSIFLHMHYKFVLEMVRSGLIEEFYEQIDRLLVAFRDPEEYRRNPVENSSFLVSSGFSVDPRQHGRGCVARLSGSTVEFLHLWTHLFLGQAPFVFEQGRLLFKPRPVLAKSLFTETEQCVKPFGTEEMLPAHSAVCTLFGSTLLVYINPERRDSFGQTPVKPAGYRLYDRDGGERAVAGECLDAEDAAALRLGRFRRIDVLLVG